MKDFLQRILRKARSSVFRRYSENVPINSRKTLIFVHIGKCAGKSLWRNLLQSPLVWQFKSIHRIHSQSPPYCSECKYVIVLRNPVRRLISAFNWRHKILMEDGRQLTRFYGEYSVLKKYGNINSLAEQLFENGVLNPEVVQDLRKIHHLKEDINYYLRKLLPHLRKDQIYCLLTTENLDEDIATKLLVTSSLRVHSNESYGNKFEQLSHEAKTNLTRYLAADYESIRKLLDIMGENHDDFGFLLD